MAFPKENHLLTACHEDSVIEQIQIVFFLLIILSLRSAENVPEVINSGIGVTLGMVRTDME